MANYDINCPHCGGELEVEDEWAGMEVTCPSCQNDFVVPPGPEPVEANSQSAAYDVFCPHCGTELEVQDEWTGSEMTCPACQNGFTVPPRPMSRKLSKRTLILHRGNPSAQSADAIPPQYGTNSYAAPQGNYGGDQYTPDRRRRRRKHSSAQDLSFFDKWGINFCVIVGFFSPAGFIIGLVALYNGAIKGFLGYILLPVFLLFGIVGVHGCYLMNRVSNPNKKIYWTPYRKFVLPVFCIICFLLGLGISINFLFGFLLNGLSIKPYSVITLFFAINGMIWSIRGWVLFNTRAREDVDFEESK